jgi:polysaccharide pyruvyl transferase WcaK-like protein
VNRAAGARGYDRRVRILVEPSAHGMVNLGDIAMLEVATARLRELWPNASMGVITDAPDRVTAHCPGTVPVSAAGRRLWLESPQLGSTLHRRLPSRATARLRSAEGSMRRRRPAVSRSAIRLRRRVKRLDNRPLDEFLDWLFGADLVVVSGAGLLADPFAPRAATVLELLETAADRGVPTAMLGQGVGPVTDEALLAVGRRVLPRLDLITLREEVAGRPLLRSMGVPEDRIVTTGDDAIEPALAGASRDALGSGIGVSVRSARYSNLGSEAMEAIGRAVRAAAEELNAELIPVPISAYAKEKDAAAIARVLDAQEEPTPSSPAGAAERVGRCRAVITGSYHGAVFALAQGIPAIGLVGSEYYAEKFGGLADQFGGGCTQVTLDAEGLDKGLEAAIHDAWSSAPDMREGLIQEAERQVEAGRGAYRRLHSIVTGAATAGADG